MILNLTGIVKNTLFVLLLNISLDEYRQKDSKNVCATLSQKLFYFLSNRRVSECDEIYFCNGEIDCNWLNPHDESNCTECPVHARTRCDCNQEGNITCEWDEFENNFRTCVPDFCKNTFDFVQLIT